MLIKTTNLFVPIVLLLLCSCRPSLASRPAPPEETGLKLEFGYQNESNKGPGAWGTINPNWKTCGQGNLQSPINILDSETQISPDLGDLKKDYQASPASVKNRGHDIMVKWGGNAGTFTVNGTVYSLKQCHWHSPSEHTFNGSSRLLEAHMVHETPNGKIAVVAITYVSGEADPFLAKIMANIINLQDEKDIGSVDPRNIDPGSKSYYRYIGSLTTPPCTEGVIWTVMKEPRTVSPQQVLALSAAVDKDSRQNARPVQSSKGRKVFVYA